MTLHAFPNEQVPFVLTIPGIPQQQGSKTRTRFGMRDDNRNLKPWRMVALAAAADVLAPYEEMLPLYVTAVAVHVVFAFPRPRSHYGTGRNARTVKPGAPDFHTVKPDCDKLQRAVGDVLTLARIVHDDNLIAVWRASKVYTTGTPSTVVEISALTGGSRP